MFPANLEVTITFHSIFDKSEKCKTFPSFVDCQEKYGVCLRFTYLFLSVLISSELFLAFRHMLLTRAQFVCFHIFLCPSAKQPSTLQSVTQLTMFPANLEVTLTFHSIFDKSEKWKTFPSFVDCQEKYVVYLRFIYLFRSVSISYELFFCVARHDFSYALDTCRVIGGCGITAKPLAQVRWHWRKKDPSSSFSFALQVAARVAAEEWFAARI
jgi:hypothetical protein